LCLNLGGAEWGWTPAAADQMMSRDSCIRLLVTVVCQDGNLLLNVGPKPDGEIEPAQVQRLREIGRFLLKYGESIYRTRGGVYDAQWGGTTITDTAIYVHILRAPHDGTITLSPIHQRIVAARTLEDAAPVMWHQSDAGVTLSNISARQDEPDHIIKLMLK
jgi:alpha-L-fucosidase